MFGTSFAVNTTVYIPIKDNSRIRELVFMHKLNHKIGSGRLKKSYATFSLQTLINK